VGGIGHPDRGQLVRTMQLGQRGRIAAIGLHPVPGLVDNLLRAREGAVFLFLCEAYQAHEAMLARRRRGQGTGHLRAPRRRRLPAWPGLAATAGRSGDWSANISSCRVNFGLLMGGRSPVGAGRSPGRVMVPRPR
jgi:hypothetical protein